MTIEAGAVVILKSGGAPMTVVAVDDDIVECVWCGDEGDLFREKIPTVALEMAMPLDPEDEDDESDEDETDEENDEDEVEADKKVTTKRTAA